MDYIISNQMDIINWSKYFEHCIPKVILYQVIKYN